MEYDSAIKRNETGSFVEIWMDLETAYKMKSEREKGISYIHAYVKSRKMVQMNQVARQK